MIHMISGQGGIILDMVIFGQWPTIDFRSVIRQEWWRWGL